MWLSVALPDIPSDDYTVRLEHAKARGPSTCPRLDMARPCLPWHSRTPVLLPDTPSCLSPLPTHARTGARVPSVAHVSQVVRGLRLPALAQFDAMCHVDLMLASGAPLLSLPALPAAADADGATAAAAAAAAAAADALAPRRQRQRRQPATAAAAAAAPHHLHRQQQQQHQLPVSRDNALLLACAEAAMQLQLPSLESLAQSATRFTNAVEMALDEHLQAVA